MNELIKNYMNGKDKEDFKKDLVNLIKPICKNIIDLTGKDPQNNILENFMKQKNLNV